MQISFTRLTLFSLKIITKHIKLHTIGWSLKRGFEICIIRLIKFSKSRDNCVKVFEAMAQPMLKNPIFSSPFLLKLLIARETTFPPDSYSMGRFSYSMGQWSQTQFLIISAPDQLYKLCDTYLESGFHSFFNGVPFDGFCNNIRWKNGLKNVVIVFKYYRYDSMFNPRYLQ